MHGEGAWPIPSPTLCLATSPSRSSLVPSKYSMTAMIFIVMLSFYYFSRHVSYSAPSGGPFLPSPLCCHYSPKPDFCMLKGSTVGPQLWNHLQHFSMEA